ncbi:hypothetical protein GH714_005513 [Hevea brasiliensis]|uniref:NmrA-like domain-containing protein n=1 Tax=Hevea brasiliensis TaxID=3981 RepID=A0A6A6LVL0_HEVBR|nr:hypothetical protein GH714_005513 [Hevea brasiliensis]
MGELDEHDKIVALLGQVDVVISALAYPQVLDQLKIIDAIKVAAVLNYEEDIAIYTIKAADDPRTLNRVVIYRPEKNIISQFELISLWEKKTGQSLNKVHISEKHIVELSKTLPHPRNIPVAILHSLFVKGDLMSYELEKDDLEVSKLYPDFEYTTLDRLLDIFLVNPPEPAFAAFE